MTKKKSVAVDVAVEQEHSLVDEVVVLSTGIRARIVPVAATLIDEIGARIPDPPIPTQNIDGKEHENPMHPEYRQALRDARNARTTATLDAFVMFGVDLVDGVPEDDGWVEKIRFMEKRGMIDLSVYDLTSDLEREFVFKRFIAVASKDMTKIGVSSGVLSADIERAMDSFRSDEERDSDTEDGAEEST
jgi:hypothetical protein